MRTDEARMLHLQAHVDRLEALRRGQAFPPPPPPAKRGRRRGSFNHESLLRVGQYADGKLAENGPEAAREALIEWLDGQTQEGHCVKGNAIETSSASHCQLNEAAAGVGLFFAEDRNDGLLIEKFRDWWWTEVTLCEACEVPGSGDRPWTKDLVTVWAPGWRALQKGKLIAWNPGRDLCYRLIKGYDVPSRKEKPKLYTTDRYNLAFRALNMLPAESLKALRPAPGWIPPLPFPLEVFRAKRVVGFEAIFRAPAGGDVARYAGWDEVLGFAVAAEGSVTRFFDEQISYPAVERSAK